MLYCSNQLSLTTSLYICSSNCLTLQLSYSNAAQDWSAFRLSDSRASGLPRCKLQRTTSCITGDVSWTCHLVIFRARIKRHKQFSGLPSDGLKLYKFISQGKLVIQKKPCIYSLFFPSLLPVPAFWKYVDTFFLSAVAEQVCRLETWLHFGADGGQYSSLHSRRTTHKNAGWTKKKWGESRGRSK